MPPSRYTQWSRNIIFWLKRQCDRHIASVHKFHTKDENHIFRRFNTTINDFFVYLYFFFLNRGVHARVCVNIVNTSTESSEKKEKKSCDKSTFNGNRPNENRKCLKLCDAWMEQANMRARRHGVVRWSIEQCAIACTQQWFQISHSASHSECEWI